MTSRDLVECRLVPGGGLPKPENERIAAEVGLEVAAKPDSQNICFVPDGDYASLVKKLRPDTDRPGAGFEGTRPRARPAASRRHVRPQTGYRSTVARRSRHEHRAQRLDRAPDRGLAAAVG